MRHPTYLHCSRHGVYYFRARTPHALRQRHPELAAEVKASLGSKNRRFACALAHLVFRQWVDWVADLERQDLPTMTKPRLSGWITYDDPILGRVLRTTPEDTPESLANAAELVKWLESRRTAGVSGHGTGSPPPNTAPAAPAPPSATGIEPPASLPSLPSTVDAPTLAADATSATTVAVGGFDPAAGFTAHQGKQAEWLSDVIEKWHRHKVNTKAWKAASTWTNAYGPDLRIFRELVADQQRIPAAEAAPIWDLRMGDLDEARLGRFLDGFWQYPGQQGKRPGSRDARDVLAQAEQRRQKEEQRKATSRKATSRKATAATDDDVDEDRAQTVFNAKKRLGRIRAFLGWAARLNYLSRDALVELEMGLEDGPKVDPKGGYRAYSSDELQRIFDSPEYAADTFLAAWQYFAPPLALCMGPRVREIADLTVDDFITVEGFPCIHFCGGDVVEHGPNGSTVVRRRLKTPGSERKLPVPQALIDLGLLDHVAARRAAGKVWLWDGLLWEEKSGNGRYITEWFATYLKALRIKAGRATVFHSFRSNLNQRLSGRGFADSTIDRILGHSPKTIRGKHYSKNAEGEHALPVPQVRDMLNQIDWGVTFHRSNRWGGNPPA
jgi:hypothetical protein